MQDFEVALDAWMVIRGECLEALRQYRKAYARIELIDALTKPLVAQYECIWDMRCLNDSYQVPTSAAVPAKAILSVRAIPIERLGNFSRALISLSFAQTVYGGFVNLVLSDLNTETHQEVRFARSSVQKHIHCLVFKTRTSAQIWYFQRPFLSSVVFRCAISLPRSQEPPPPPPCEIGAWRPG